MFDFLKNLIRRSTPTVQINTPAASAKPPATTAAPAVSLPPVDQDALNSIDEWIDIHSRSGFGHIDDLCADLEDIVLDWGIDDVDPWLQKFKTARAAHIKAQTSFPQNTLNDRLTEAFTDLNTRGILAFENLGYTQSDGWADLHQFQAERNTPAIGGVFYHGQDLERGVLGHGLAIRFGAFGDGDSVEIAKLTREVLAVHGIETEWNGDEGQVIDIPPFEWQRRLN